MAASLHACLPYVLLLLLVVMHAVGPAHGDVFSVVQLTTALNTGTSHLNSCKPLCNAQGGAFVAWVYSLQESQILLSLLPVAVQTTARFILGGQRVPVGSSTMRWTEGPPGTMNAGQGQAIVTGTGASKVCHLYCNYNSGEPSSTGEPVLEMFWNLKWNDRSATGSVADGLSYCACRRVATTQSASGSEYPSATATAVGISHSFSQSSGWSPTTSSTAAQASFSVSSSQSGSQATVGLTATSSSSRALTLSLTSRSISQGTQEAQTATTTDSSADTPSLTRSTSATADSTLSWTSSASASRIASRSFSQTTEATLSTSPSRTISLSMFPSSKSVSDNLTSTTSPSKTHTSSPTSSTSPSGTTSPSKTHTSSPTSSTTPSGTWSLSSTSTHPSTSMMASASQTGSRCHYVTGDDPATAVRYIEYDNTTIVPVHALSPWGHNASTTSPHPNASSGDASLLLSFTITKTNALRGGGSAVVLVVVVQANMTVHPSFEGATIAATYGAKAVVGNGSSSRERSGGVTTIVVSFRPIGNQYLAQEDMLWIPLRIIAGACVNSTAPMLLISLRMTPTVPLGTVIASTISKRGLPIAAMSSPATAVALSRLSILKALIECNVDLDDNDGNSLLGIALGPRSGQYMRGAVVGNLLLVCALGLVASSIVLLVAGVWRVWYGIPMRSSTAALLDVVHLPGLLWPPTVGILQVGLCWIVSAVQLLAMEPVNGDRMLGGMAVAVMVAVIVLPFTIVMCRHFCLVLECRHAGDMAMSYDAIRRFVDAVTCAPNRPPEKGIDAAASLDDIDDNSDDAISLTGCADQPQDDDDVVSLSHPPLPEAVAPPPTQRAATSFRGLVVAAIMRLFVPTHHWAAAPGSGAHGKRWKQRYLLVFVDSRTWWFPLVDLWMALVVGTAGGLTLGDKSLCRSQLGVVTLAYLVGVCVQVFVVTALIPVSRIYAAALQLLGIVVCGAIVAVVVQDENGETLALTIATMGMLAIAALSAIKGVLDVLGLALSVCSVARAIRRTLGVLQQHADGDAAAMNAAPENGKEEFECDGEMDIGRESSEDFDLLQPDELADDPRMENLEDVVVADPSAVIDDRDHELNVLLDGCDSDDYEMQLDSLDGMMNRFKWGHRERNRVGSKQNPTDILYQFYFGNDADGDGQATVDDSAPHETEGEYHSSNYAEEIV